MQKRRASSSGGVEKCSDRCVKTPVVLFAVAWFALPEDPQRTGARPKLDLIGVGLLAIAMLLLVLPLSIGREMQCP
jgi:hypothetical protein